MQQIQFLQQIAIDLRELQILSKNDQQTTDLQEKFRIKIQGSMFIQLCLQFSQNRIGGRSLEENLQNLKVLAKILALINRLLLVYQLLFIKLLQQILYINFHTGDIHTFFVKISAYSKQIQFEELQEFK
ncbi:hypothetical protein pb186bvf_005314 [Paramecium bursaria]